MGWLALPREWMANLGTIARFCARVMGLVYSGRVFRFFGEALRQAGILILGSALVIWGLTFIPACSAGSRAPTSHARSERPLTPASLPPGAIFAR